MIREFAVNTFRFVLLVFLQIFVLNHIQFSGFLNPFLYVMFILLLPFETSGWLILVLAFVLGMVIDIASVTVGYHTVATVFMAYFRFHLLWFIAPRDGYEPGMTPTIRSLGFAWFLKYTVVLTLVHHLVLFWVESFEFSDMIPATLRAVASTVFTVTFIVICQFLAMRHK